MIGLLRRWRCRSAAPLLVDLAEGSLAPAEEARVERHLRDCASCRGALAALRAVPARLRDEPEPVPAASWERQRQDIMRAVRNAPPQPARSATVPGWRVVTAMAATACVAAIAASLLRPPTPDGIEVAALLRTLPEDPETAADILELVPGAAPAAWQDVADGAAVDLLDDIALPLASLLGADWSPAGEASGNHPEDPDDLDDVVGTWLLS
jgi:hypothetical protein